MELTQLEKKATEDQDFASQLEEQRKLHEFMTEGALLDIRNDLQNIHQQASLGNGGANTLKRYLFPGIGILIILSAIFLLRQKSAPPEITETNSFAPAQDSVVERRTIPVKIAVEIEPKDSNEKNYSSEKNPVSSEKSIEKTDSHIPEESKSVKSSDGDINLLINSGEESAITTDSIAPEINGSDSSPRTQVDQVNCEEVVIEADISLTASCAEKATGEIKIIAEDIMGGKSPYRVSIDNADNYYQQFEFENLYSRVYAIWIKDQDGCQSKIGNYRLNSVECSYEKAFAPLMDERWKVPSRDKSAHLKIFSQQGEVIFTWQIEAGTSFYWDGNSSSDDPLPMGLYPFILEFEEEENLTGTITIVK